MAQSSNKIQIPVKTKNVFLIVVLLVLFDLATVKFPPPPDCLCIYGIDGLASVILFIFSIIFMLLASVLFLNKKYKFVWHTAFIFLMVNVLICAVVFAVLQETGRLLLPLAVSMIALSLLLFDRKDYFAAVEKAKNPAKP